MNAARFDALLLKRAALLAFALSAVAAHAEGKPEPTLCKEQEVVVFNCLYRQKIASLCASPALSKDSGQVKYRFGMTGKIELEYPRGDNDSRERFLFSNTGYSGGGESHIRFVNAKFTYWLYDKMIRTGFPGDPGNPEGTNKPVMSAGVIVLKKGARSSRLACRNNASISSVAYQALEREDFQDGLTD